MRHAQMVSNLESMIETEQVRCVTFATLFNEVGAETVDMLQIDAEGLDAQILEWFDISLRRPPIVRFEHKHLSIADHEKSIGLLIRNGYRVAALGTDTLAYRESASLSARD